MMKPLGARLLVKRIDAPTPKSDLIVIPETVGKAPSIYAAVYAVGPQVDEDVKMGDVVIIKEYSGAPVEVDLEDGTREEMFIVPLTSVLAVVEL